jgi:NAD(P)-dependent dehydrogenase (short-subunit alcohol dehydrogenase family)
MNVLVTGGTGFVGSHAVAALARAGHDLRLLVRRPEQVSAPQAFPRPTWPMRRSSGLRPPAPRSQCQWKPCRRTGHLGRPFVCIAEPDLSSHVESSVTKCDDTWECAFDLHSGDTAA